MKNNDFMNKRLTKDAGEAFSPARYSLKSRNDAIISPYKTYELFFEITFMVIQKLGAYEDIGTPDECMEAMRTARACNAQYLDDIKNPLEPLKVTSALKSELLKLQIRQAKKPKSISPLDYTIIAALIKVLKNRWHDINEELPEPGEYVLVLFENEGLTLPDIGRYETEDDGSGAFYPGDDDASYASFGIFVNAWMPLPEIYRREE
jgi:hypothetical protein|nr:MAG TPA: Protein of unknown function (DUF551) [Caudoviricetes sp.]